MTVRAWRVHDTGLVAAPGPFRRLPGRVRHHAGTGPTWPDRLELTLLADPSARPDPPDGARAPGGISPARELLVRTPTGEDVGRWPVTEVAARRVAAGPPVHFVLEVDGGAHLLAAAADDATAALLAALGA